MSTAKNVFLFPGQGAQYYNMGVDFWEENTGFKMHMIEMDELVKKEIKASVVEHIFDKRKNFSHQFDDLLLSSLAIFMIAYASARALQNEGVTPDYVLGTSLGEYAACVTCGKLDVADAIKSIILNAHAIQDTCPPAEMLTVFARPDFYYDKTELNRKSELTAVNYAEHFVIGYKQEYSSDIEHFLKKEQVDFQKLPVRYAFHTALINNSREHIQRAGLVGISEKENGTRYISGVYGKEVNIFDKNYFWEVLRQPILFREAIAFLEGSGEKINYIDAGPSGTLAGFTKYNLNHPTTAGIFPLITPFRNSKHNFSEIIKHCKRTMHNAVNVVRTGTRTAIVFPGQGSQRIGMGANLFDEFPALTEKADNLLGYSIKELCLENRGHNLNKTAYTQPALYVVNALSYYGYLRTSGEDPHYLAGHSLGEFNALLASGVFDFETGLRLVQKRGALMSQMKEGGMAAVLGLEEDAVKNLLANEGLDAIDIANINAPGQIVISGPGSAIRAAQSVFEQKGAEMYIPLNVSGAFHSRYMEAAGKEFAGFIAGFDFSAITIPVLSNATGALYTNENLKENLCRQLTNPVRWAKCIEFLLDHHVQEFMETGPGDVLTKVITRIRNTYKPRITIEEEYAAAMVKSKAHFNGNGEFSEVTTAVLPSQVSGAVRIVPESLGSEAFREEYGVRYNCIAGGMYRGISSARMVIRMAKAGLLSFFGTGGLDITTIQQAVEQIQSALTANEPYGLNIVSNPFYQQEEMRLINLCLAYGINTIEASAFMQITPPLVKYRLKGAVRRQGEITVANTNRIIAKVSRPEIARLFMMPCPEAIVQQLLLQNEITTEEATLSKYIPVANDICVEADSAGHTDQGNLSVLFPAVACLRKELAMQYDYAGSMRIGAAGGIGTPEAATTAFMLGADFIMTGSVNQCSYEADISHAVKDLLASINVNDTAYAPAGDLFELGAKIQVVKKGVFFPSRANKLYELYNNWNAIEEIDEATRKQIAERYFKKSFEEVYEETRTYFLQKDPEQIDKAEKNPKHKMALIFRWYFGKTMRAALNGEEEDKVNFQVHCGPALGAFNQWVKGTAMEDWRNRHVDEINYQLITETALFMSNRINTWIK